MRLFNCGKAGDGAHMGKLYCLQVSIALSACSHADLHYTARLCAEAACRSKRARPESLHRFHYGRSGTSASAISGSSRRSRGRSRSGSRGRGRAVTVAVAGGTSSSSINWQAGAGQVDVVWERLDTLQLLARAAPPQARRRLLQPGHVGRQHRFLFALLGESDGLSKGTGKETSGRRSSSASAAESCEQDRRRSSQILKHKARTCMVRTTRLRYSCILKFALASRRRRRKRAQRLCA